MFVATLLVNPRAGRLDPALVTALRDAWGGGTLRWLGPDVACEFDLPARPENAGSAWADLQSRATDLVIQPGEGRRKRLLIADMDSTMIEQECIDELAAEAGVGSRVAEITARAMNGDLDFEAALKERVGLLRGLDMAVIDRVLTTRITLAPGGPELVSTMRVHGAHAALVSGGFTAFTGSVADKLGFDEHHANTLLTEQGRLTGEVARPILGRDAKVAALEKICARLRISEGDALAVGDGANDLGMIDRAGSGVAMHAKPAVAAQARIRINHGDLTALLYIQGYSSDDFV
ncbi:MAG: phosphoserine phosphatase SerB [Pseudomonadota bacterium]